MNFVPEGGEDQVLEARVQAVRTVLNSPELHTPDYSETGLVGYWCDELADGIRPTIDRNKRKWGRRNALVIQFADGMLHYEPEAKFADAYLEALGAEARFPSTEGKAYEAVPANSQTISEIVQDPALQHLDYGKTASMDEVPEGSWLLVGENGSRPTLVLNTRIDGVRLVLDGSVVSSPNSEYRSLRPMLLIEVAEHSFTPQPTAEDIASAPKTWLEVHGRDPRKQEAGKHHGQRILDQALVTETDDLAMAAAEVSAFWKPGAKDPKDIMVTPTKLLAEPMMVAEEERLAVLRETLDIATKHLRLAERRKIESSVVGATAASLSIIVDVLQMTPEEIVRDGEAMADLVEYVEEMARPTRGVWGHSSLLDEAPEGDPNMELVTLIKNTWDLPYRGFSPFMYNRVDWGKQAKRAEEN